MFALCHHVNGNVCIYQGDFLCIVLPFISSLVHITSCEGTGVPGSLHWPHNGRDGISNDQPHNEVGRRPKNTSKLRVTGHCAANSPVTGEFPAQGLVTRKMFQFDDVIMELAGLSDVSLVVSPGCAVCISAISCIRQRYVESVQYRG